MKIIQQYQSEDGKIFNNEQECEKYEVILAKVNKILSDMPCGEKIDRFTNGRGYIQHSADVVQSLKESIVELANEYFNPKDNYKYFNYYLSRCIDDSNMKCLSKMSYKIMCIDEDNREWGQPYFAAHPNEAEQIRLN